MIKIREKCIVYHINVETVWLALFRMDIVVESAFLFTV